MSTYFEDQPLLNTMQGGEAWFKARSKITITASNFAAVLGILPFETSEHNYKRLLSTREAAFDTKQWHNITWGKEMEGVARQFLRDYFFPEIREVGTFIYLRDPRLGATPDGVIVDGIKDKKLTLLEIKCPAQEKNFARKGIPIWNLMQLYGEMAATGVDNTIFMSWLPQKFSLFWVTFDKRIWDQMLYPKLRAIVDSIDARYPWNPRMTIWKDELEKLNELLVANVFKVCEFSDLPGGGLRWHLRDIIRNGENIHIDVSHISHVQKPSTQGLASHLGFIEPIKCIPTKLLDMYAYKPRPSRRKSYPTPQPDEPSTSGSNETEAFQEIPSSLPVLTSASTVPVPDPVLMLVNDPSAHEFNQLPEIIRVNALRAVHPTMPKTYTKYDQVAAWLTQKHLNAIKAHKAKLNKKFLEETKKQREALKQSQEQVELRRSQKRSRVRRLQKQRIHNMVTGMRGTGLDSVDQEA